MGPWDAAGDTVRRALAVVLKTGDTTASFTYRVLCTDADRDAPLGGAPCLHILEHGGEINGSPFIMTFERGPYTTGALYTYSATLLRGRAYTYYIDAIDTTGRQAVATPIAPSPTAPIAGPQLLLPNGDVNKDGHMTPADALCIFRAFMRLPSCMD